MCSKVGAAGRWQALGGWIGGHLAVLAPICAAVGVLAPDVFSPVNEHAVPALFAFMTFQGALSNTFAQVGAVFKHPTRMLIIIFVSMLAMPVAAWVAACALFDDPAVLTGIVLEFSVPVAVVSFMWVGMYRGDTALMLGTILVSTVLAPFHMPAMLNALLGQSVQVDAVGMMADMLKMVAIPAVAGMIVNEATHGKGVQVLSPALAPAAKLALLVIITSNATGMAPYVMHPTPLLFEIAGFVLVFSAAAYALGILVAHVRREPYENVVTLCFGCGIKNISAGAVIASRYFPGTIVVLPAMAATLFQQVLAACFGMALRRIEKKVPKGSGNGAGGAGAAADAAGAVVDGTAVFDAPAKEP